MSAPAEMEPQRRSLTPPQVDGGADFDASAIDELAAMEMDEPQIDGEEEVMAELPAQDDPLTAHVTAGGIVSTYRNQDERKQRLEMKQAGDYIRAAKQQVADTTKDLESAELRMRKAQQNANRARQEAQMLYDQLVDHADAEKVVPNRHGLALARQQYDAAAYRMNHADAVAQREYSIVVWQQDRVTAAELAVMKTEELEQRVVEMETAELEEMRQVAEYRGARELEAAERQHRAALEAVDDLERDREDLAMRTEQALMVADEGQKGAKMRLHEATKGLAQKLQELAEYKRAEKTRQQQSLLSLKANSEEAYNKMAAVNERNRKKKIKEDAAHESERKVILQNGGNPYEVFRRRREEERQVKEYHKLEAKQRAGEAKIADMMVREEELFQRDMKQHAIEKEYELHFQKEMGLAAKEERVDKFMKKRALGGVDIIDPTSIKESALVAVQSSFGETVVPAPLHGSHNTVVKTSRFGLGDVFERANEGAAGPYSDDVLEAVQARHPGTTFDPTFAGTEYQVPDDGPEQFDASALGDSAVDRYGELIDELAQPEFKGMWKDGTAYGGEESRGLIDPEEVERQRREALKIKTTTLSKLEKDMMDTVPDKIRKNIVKPQIACGREFKGKSFLAENLTHPELQDRIEFRDFKVGKIYKQTIRLTNVSYTFNTFKLQRLQDDICDFFEIKYKLPGYISAGLTCDLHITFEPKIPEDINVELPILAETGHIGIPLICSTPKTKISVEPRVIEFIHSGQGVPLCEEVTEYITITNSGALGTGYSLMDPEAWTPESMLADAAPADGAAAAADADDPVPEVSVEPEGSGGSMNLTAKVSDEEQMIQDIYASTPDDRRVLRFDKAGLVQGYKSVRVPVTFRPCVLGQWSGRIVINFADAGTPDVTINLRATVTEVPIFLKRPINDFQTVCYNHVYRDSLVVYNRGKTAMKCELSLPEHAICLRKSLEFLPPLGFPQNGSLFAFQIKFRPELSIWKKIPAEYGDPTTGKIEFPMLVTVPDQSLPVRWTLKAQLTPAVLKFEPDILDFGPCSCNESVKIDVKITNASALPQEVGFVRLKAEIDVQPWDGFFPLKPGQSTVVEIMFKPRSAIDYQFPLICKAITGKQTVLDPTLAVESEYTIHCRGRGVFPALKVSHGTMKLAAVAEGGRTSESVVLSNGGKDVRNFEFTPQPDSNLHVSPMHGSLSPGEQLRITIEFRAPTEPEEEPEPEVTKGDEVPVVADGGKKPINERWSIHKKWLVPCFFKPNADARNPQKRIITENLNVQVHTTVIRPIVADGDGLVYRELDFGQVALGPGKVVKFMLHNKGTVEASMSCSTLDPNGPFLMLSGSRPIPAGGAVQVVMCFDPPEVGLYEQTVRIQTTANEYIVVCKGEGMRPKLSIEPDLTSLGTKRGQLHVGDAVCTKTVSKTLKLCNETEQPMSWSVGITDLKRRNANGLEPFYVVPPQGTIPGQGEMDVEVRFCPDHQSTGFGGLLNFDVPSQNETHAIDLTGRGWACGTYIVGGDEAPEEARSDMMAHVLPDLFEGLGSVEVETKKLRLTLGYDMDLPEGMTAPAAAKGAAEVDEDAPLAVGLVVVGNAGDAAEKAANGDVAFGALPADAVEKGFGMVVEGKLAFGPQDSGRVAFTFRSPPLPEGSSAATLQKLGVGFWAETTITGTCKGGTPAPEGGAAAFELTLRAYVGPPPAKEEPGKSVTIG